MSIAFQYQDAVTERLFAAAKTPAQAFHAQAVLWQITRNLGWQSYECTKTAADLCEVMRTDKGDMARALDLLEQVGAIRRVKRGRVKIITVTPEGAFRGNVHNHAQAVERGGQADLAGQARIRLAMSARVQQSGFVLAHRCERRHEVAGHVHVAGRAGAHAAAEREQVAHPRVGDGLHQGEAGPDVDGLLQTPSVGHVDSGHRFTPSFLRNGALAASPPVASR